ncbi:hypothetical protein PPTG_20363, partial [Phytophthora nicotianae INRA-310]
MEALVLGGNTFRNFPSARYATDIAFQQSNMPIGQMKERADKGYQGLAADFRAITTFKKQPLRELTLEQVEINDRIAHDRVLVENYCGRLCTLWAMCSDKY